MNTYFIYEFYGVFKNHGGRGISSNVSLGTKELKEYDIPTSGETRKNYLMGIAKASFPGEIAKKGELIEVRITKRGPARKGEKTKTKSKKKKGGLGKRLLKGLLAPDPDATHKW